MVSIPELQSAKLLSLSSLLDFTPDADPHQRRAAMMQHLAELMAAQSTAMKVWADSYPFTDLTPLYKDGAARLAKFGWTVPMQMGLRQMLEILKETDADAIDKYFLNFYHQRYGDPPLRDLQGISRSALLSGWRALLEQCFDNYARGQHLICIPALLTVLEGAIAVPEGAMFVNSPQRKALFDEKIEEGGDLGGTVWDSMRIFFDNLYQNSDFAGARPSSLNRHWILHGRDEPDWRQADALRLFHTLFTLSSIFSLSKERD